MSDAEQALDGLDDRAHHLCFARVHDGVGEQHLLLDLSGAVPNPADAADEE